MATYKLTLTEEHLHVLLAAAELHERIAMGQLKEIVRAVDPNYKLPPDTRETAAEALMVARYYLMPGLTHSNAYYSIHAAEVNDTNRVLYDFLQVVRHRLAWDRNPKGGISINFDEPRRTSSKLDLIKIERESDEPALKKLHVASGISILEVCMNYEEAAAKLNHPKSQEKKNIGHKLWLHKLPVSYQLPPGMKDTPPIALRYFSTDVLTFYVDGSVRVDPGAWLRSSCTRDKINKFLPRGWRLIPFHLRFQQGMAALLCVGEKAYPYAHNKVFYAEGRIDKTVINAENGWELKDRINAAVVDAVGAFLEGKLSPKTPLGVFSEVVVKCGAVEEEPGEYEALVVDMLQRKLELDSFVQLLYASYLSPIKRWNAEALKQLQLYWAENYPFTKRPRTNKERVDRLEWLMRQPELLEVRYQKNSKEFFAFRKTLLAATEELLLSSVGFQIF